MSSKSVPGVKLGLRVVTLMAPAVVFLPKSVPCGPRSTSTWSTSRKSSVADGGTGVEDAVDVETDARLEAVVGEPERRAEAADVDRRVARIGRIELHRGNHLLQTIHVEGAGVGDEVAVSRPTPESARPGRASSTRRAVTTTDWLNRAGLSVTSIAAV